VLLYSSRDEYAEGHPYRPPDLPHELIREIDEKLGGFSRGQERKDRCIWFDSESRCCKH